MEGEQRVADGFTWNHRNKHAVGASCHVLAHRLVAGEAVVDDRGALGGVEHAGSQADQTAGGDGEAQQGVLTAWAHRFEQSASISDHFHHRANSVRWDFDVEDFEWFMQFAVDSFHDDSRLADTHLIAFATHGFDQYGQVQNPSASHSESIRAVDLADTQSDVAFEFAVESSFELAIRDVFTVAACQRRGVHTEDHFEGRFVHFQSW